MTETLVLASESANGADALVSFAWIMGAALLAPLLSHLTGWRIPAVPLLIGLGMILGPSILDLAHDGPGVAMLSEIGVGALFLLAGFEINLSSLRSAQAGHALATWAICLVICIAAAYFMFNRFDFGLAAVLAIAVTSTALGTITPMLKQAGLTGTKVGDAVMIHGAVGEMAPIVAMALLLSARSTWVTGLILLAFFAIALVVALAPKIVSRLFPFVKTAFIHGAGSTNQTILRLIIFMLAVLMAVAAVFELDVVLGAFATGIILNQIIPDEYHKQLEHRLDVVFYSMLIPGFFVVSGMRINWDVIADNPWKVLGVVPLIFICRGLPVFLRERFTPTGSGLSDVRDQLQVAFYAAAGLPIIVAVMSIAQASNIISAEHASIFIAGGALTVTVFPIIASALDYRHEI